MNPDGREEKPETQITPHVSHCSRWVKISDYRCREVSGGKQHRFIREDLPWLCVRQSFTSSAAVLSQLQHAPGAVSFPRDIVRRSTGITPRALLPRAGAKLDYHGQYSRLPASIRLPLAPHPAEKAYVSPEKPETPALSMSAAVACLVL